MPIPDPDKIWPKLEETGLAEVKKRLLIGAYAKYKIPVIEEWIRLKEKELNGDREAEVRDVSLGAFPNHSAVVWVRIGVPPN